MKKLFFLLLASILLYGCSETKDSYYSHDARFVEYSTFEDGIYEGYSEVYSGAKEKAIVTIREGVIVQVDFKRILCDSGKEIDFPDPDSALTRLYYANRVVLAQNESPDYSGEYATLSQYLESAVTDAINQARY